MYYESDSSPCSPLDIPQLDTESRSMCGSDSSVDPLHQNSQSDPESSSMCGSDDTTSSDEDSEDADDPVSKIWWRDDSESGASASVENQDLIPEGDEDPNERFFQLPGSLKDLRKQLLGDYVRPTEPPKHSCIRELTAPEIISLQHYVAWRKSNGTVYAYKLHADVLSRASNVEVLSQHQVKKLAQDLTEFVPCMIDMCPRSCIAYTGAYESLSECPYIHPGKGVCNEKRFHKPTSSGRLKPRAQVQILPVMETIRTMYANAETASLLRNRDSCLQAALHIVGTAATRKYSDFGDSQVHVMQRRDFHLFQDPRDVAFALSTDGAQLTMKKQSNTWIMILIILNLPGSIRYQTNNVIINFATPGPYSPGDIESFIWALFKEMARASEGIWMWDAIDSAYFVQRSCASMALGDMLGSAKLNGMAGHTAIFGDRFSMVQGAKSSLIKGAKSQYYPMNPPDNERYNPSRPVKYDLSKIPMRSQTSYWATIDKLAAAKTKKEKSEITKATGVSRLPLCAASVAFTHPTFFPLDPFHLFYENCMAFIWDTWTVLSKPGEVIHLSSAKAQNLGRLIPPAMSTLPPAFCGPIRDPYLKRQSQYKVYEWMALLHWYIIPIGTEIGMDPTVLQNFSRFVAAIEFAMIIQPRDDAELQKLHKIITKFLEEYERLYIGNDPNKILRARLCIFQLIHVPHHIQWNGSIRVGSQATVERAIGEMGHKIRSKKSPFANLANLIYERELVKILSLYYPIVDPSISAQKINVDNSDLPLNQVTSKFIQEHPLRKKAGARQDVLDELQVVGDFLKCDPLGNEVLVRRWGKFKLLNGFVLGSRLSTQKAQSARRSEWFEVCFLLFDSMSAS